MPPPLKPFVARALSRDRRREAAAERSRVSEQVRLVEALLVGGEEVRPARAAAREGVERVRLTSGDAGPGHVSAVDVGRVPGRVETVAVFELHFEVGCGRAVSRVRNRVAREVQTSGVADFGCGRGRRTRPDARVL